MVDIQVDVTSSADRSHGGRHLDESRDHALHVAAMELLGEIGYDGLTMDAVAQRAHAGKATIYRRWSNKAELVVDALHCGKDFSEGVPDTGSFRGDLHALTQGATENPGDMTQIMIGLVSALPHDKELRDAFRERLVEPKMAGMHDILSRAVQRGEIPELRNPELVVSLLPALIMHRLIVLDGALDREYLESIINDVIVPLVSYIAPSTTEDTHPERKP